MKDILPPQGERVDNSYVPLGRAEEPSFSPSGGQRMILAVPPGGEKDEKLVLPPLEGGINDIPLPWWEG